MQLIVETETAVDIKLNMSILDNKLPEADEHENDTDKTKALFGTKENDKIENNKEDIITQEDCDVQLGTDINILKVNECNGFAEDKDISSLDILNEKSIVKNLKEPIEQEDININSSLGKEILDEDSHKIIVDDKPVDIATNDNANNIQENNIKAINDIVKIDIISNKSENEKDSLTDTQNKQDVQLNDESCNIISETDKNNILTDNISIEETQNLADNKLLDDLEKVSCSLNEKEENKSHDKPDNILLENVEKEKVSLSLDEKEDLIECNGTKIAEINDDILPVINEIEKKCQSNITVNEEKELENKTVEDEQTLEDNIKTKDNETKQELCDESKSYGTDSEMKDLPNKCTKESDIAEHDLKTDSEKLQNASVLCKNSQETHSSPMEVVDLEDINEIEPEKKVVQESEKKKYSLSNNLDILSDDDDDDHNEQPALNTEKVETNNCNNEKIINLVDDDDIMLIDEEIDNMNDKSPTCKPNEAVSENKKDLIGVVKDIESSGQVITEVNTDCEIIPQKINTPIIENNILNEKDDKTDANVVENIVHNKDDETKCEITSKITESEKTEITEIKETELKPLLAKNFLSTCKKNIAEMTREDLEEFCVLKIVESILDRTSLSEIKNKIKSLSQTAEEYKKKALAVQKQNRDLQVVLKSVQEEQKKPMRNAVVALKITRSVGMQVLMTEKNIRRRPLVGNIPVAPNTCSNIATIAGPLPRSTRQTSTNSTVQTPTKVIKPPTPTLPIPVPRLVPANCNVNKTTQPNVNNRKTVSPLTNGNKISPQKPPEKRTRMQSETVDLTDDEPPAKIQQRSPAVPPLRAVNTQNLMPPQKHQNFQNSPGAPRKVFIPITPQSSGIRPGDVIKGPSVPRLRGPAMVNIPQQNIRPPRKIPRHPAPLPEVAKQYSPNWKALPPAPDLKLSKVENGIVISWKIEGYQEDSYEEIASYQLYAYQETTHPPNTTLWKKIGDVKALPLPMACTLTQFMAGYKYYFAVRAVDIKSRLGPFSLPGSILLLHKI